MKTYDSLAEYNADVAAARAAYAADQRVEAGQSLYCRADEIPQDVIDAHADITMPGPSSITGRLESAVPNRDDRQIIMLVVGGARAFFHLDNTTLVEIHQEQL